MGEKEEEKRQKARCKKKVHGRDGGARLEGVLLVLFTRKSKEEVEEKNVEVKRGTLRRDKAWREGEDGFFSFCYWDKEC